ncbi:MAG: hypothetical protein ACKOBD_13445 [Chloroflexota bacterium]|jgi:hypothetical protein
MNTLFRILVILVVATIIGGLMYVGVSASGSSASFGDFEEGEERPQPPEGFEFRPEGEEQEDRDSGFGFPGGVIKALVLMSIAGGIYSTVMWTGKKAKRSTAS